MNTIVIGAFKRISFFLLLIALWELTYLVGVEWTGFWKVYMFPSPLSVGTTLWNLLLDNTLSVAVVASMLRVLQGYAISLILGIVLGGMVARFRYLDENLRPMILGLQTLPSICWLPFSILWYGLNENAIIFVIAIGSTFAIAMAIETAIKTVNPLYLRAAKTMGANRLQIYMSVIIPASLPSVTTGMKQGWSFAWRALIAGEMLSGTRGLGQVLMLGRDLADMSQVVAVMAVIMILGLAVDKLIFSPVENNIRLKWGLAGN